MSANTSNRKRVPLLLWPFWALWNLVAWIISLTGRFIAVILGLVLMIVGVVLGVTLVGLPIGIPLFIVGLLLVFRGLA